MIFIILLCLVTCCITSGINYHITSKVTKIEKPLNSYTTTIPVADASKLTYKTYVGSAVCISLITTALWYGFIHFEKSKICEIKAPAVETTP